MVVSAEGRAYDREMRTLVLAALLAGCSPAPSQMTAESCERTAEDERGTCPAGLVCGGYGFVACEPGEEHCVCVGDDGGVRCGAATCYEP